MTQLEHTAKQYMDGQLTAMNLRAMSCQTIQAQFSRNSGAIQAVTICNSYSGRFTEPLPDNE